MARGGGLANDMVVWMGKWQRKKKRAVCPDRAFTNEQGARRSQAGWLHAGKLRLPTPLSSVSPAQLLGGMEQSALSHGAHIRNASFQSGRNVVGGCNGMSICEVVNGV
jgi:hypothetical protein